MCRGETSSETTGVLGAFDLEAAKLLDFSVSNSTRRVYENSEQSFRNLRAKYSLTTTWPPDIRQIIRYIGFSSLNGYSPSTVRAYISGVSFKLRTHGNEDIAKSFIIKKYAR